MHIMTLGTSAGTPTRERNVSAAAIWRAGQKSWVLIDCGEGTQHQILRAPLSLQTLDMICITHIHGDHTYGLPGLIASAQLAGRDQPLRIVGHAPVWRMMQTVMANSDMHIQYPIEFIDVDTMSEPIEAAGFSVSSIVLSHRVPSRAYQFLEPQALPSVNKAALVDAGIPPGPQWGELQKTGRITLTDGSVLDGAPFLEPASSPRKAIIAGDNDQPELLLEAAAKADVLVHESTFTQAVLDKVGPHTQHSSALQVAQLAERAGVRNLVLTHFSARFTNDPDSSHHVGQLADEAQQAYRGAVHLAEDHAHFILNSEGVLSRKATR